MRSSVWLRTAIGDHGGAVLYDVLHYRKQSAISREIAPAGGIFSPP